MGKVIIASDSFKGSLSSLEVAQAVCEGLPAGCPCEVAAASGLTLLHPDERDVLHATTFGTGELIAHACRQGIFLISALLAGASVAGLQGVVIAQPISDVCAFLLCLPLCIHAMRHMESRS